MLNYFVLIILLFLVLIAQNIILLNEEILILSCFITFCWLTLKNFSIAFSENLNARANKIEKLLKTSLKDISGVLKSILNIQKKFRNLFQTFVLLETKCYIFINAITKWSADNSVKVSRIAFPKRLHFIVRLENQVTRLLPLLITHKLKKVANLKQFYSAKVYKSYFTCLKKISTREYIQSINKY